MHAFYIRLSRIFIPASPERKSFQLPFEYPLPLVQKNTLAEQLKFLLSTSLLKTIISLLLSDINAWCTKYETSYDKQAQWVAERFLIWVYELDCPKEKYRLATSVVQDTLNTYYPESRAAFCKEFPSLDVSEKVPSFSSRNFWVALQAFNFYRFRMCDAMETFEESCKLPSSVFDFNALDDTSFAEVQLIYATRVRENATFKVLFAVGELMKEAKPASVPTAEGLMRKYLRLNPTKTTFDWKHKSSYNVSNMSAVLSILRTILHIYYKIRLVVDLKSPLGNIEQAQLLIQSQASWCENRIPSLLALKATPNKQFFEAIRCFEAACIEEGNCLTSLATSKTILHSVLDATDLHFFKPSFLRLHLALSREDLDEKLFQKLTVKEQEKIRWRFEHVLDFTRPTFFSFVGFAKLFQYYDATYESHDCTQIVSQMLVNKEFYSTIQKIIKNPEWVNNIKEKLDSPVPYSLKYVYKMYQKSINNKMEGNIDPFDSFGNIEIPEQEFQTLVGLAKTRGWENDID